MSVLGHGVEICTTATRPASAPNGTLIFDTDVSQLLLKVGGSWVNPISNQSAGGSLSGTYPNPNVASISGLSAGGSLSGTYPNPSFASNEGWRVVGSSGNPGFQNGWTNYVSGYSTARFKKDRQNTVFIDGLIKNGSTTNAIFNLPVGYRPVSGRMIFAVQTNPNTIGRIDIDTSGNVLPIAYNSAWLSIVMSFKAE